jgi:peptidoglycan/xylan/chitin deacetylase (PgdA/CDA1 family)
VHGENLSAFSVRSVAKPDERVTERNFEKPMLPRIVQILAITTPTLLLIFGALVWLNPEWLIPRLRRSSPEVLYSIETQQPIVAMTIDDGPDAEDSQKILRVLNEYDAHATFFVITDHISGNEGILRQMIAEGHELGNHLTADEPSIQLPIDVFEDKLLQADRVLSQYAETHWLRPGSGWYNDEMLEVIAEYDYQCVLGSVYPYDPQINIHWFSAFYVLWKIKPGSVIILHDHGTRGARTAKALEIILPALARRGYQVVTLSELVDRNGSHP